MSSLCCTSSRIKPTFVIAGESTGLEIPGQTRRGWSDGERGEVSIDTMAETSSLT